MHHCEPEYVMLNMWLRKGENKIPPFATHLVGVAGFVLNAKKEVLLVKEGSKQVSGWCVVARWFDVEASPATCTLTPTPPVQTKHTYTSVRPRRKLPGGYVNLGEEFGAAACREVEEETGVKTRFRSLLSVRHQHNVSFGRSDMYVGAALGWALWFVV